MLNQVDHNLFMLTTRGRNPDYGPFFYIDNDRNQVDIGGSI